MEIQGVGEGWVLILGMTGQLLPLDLRGAQVSLWPTQTHSVLENYSCRLPGKATVSSQSFIHVINAVPAQRKCCRSCLCSAGWDNSQLQIANGSQHHLAIFSSHLSFPRCLPSLPASFFLIPRLLPSSGDDHVTCLAWKIKATDGNSLLVTAKYAQHPTSSTAGLFPWSLE